MLCWSDLQQISDQSFIFFVCLWVIVIWQEVQLWNQNAFAIVFIRIVLGEIPSLYTYIYMYLYMD